MSQGNKPGVTSPVSSRQTSQPPSRMAAQWFRHLEQIGSAVRLLDPDMVRALTQSGWFRPSGDGFPSATLGLGVSAGAEHTSTEAAALHGLPGPEKADDDGGGPDDWGRRDEPDPAGVALSDLGAELAEAAGHAAAILRLVAYLVHLHEKAAGRVDSTAGDCQCCERRVSGSIDDRLRSAMCEKCFKAWCRTDRGSGRLDRARFRQLRHPAGCEPGVVVDLPAGLVREAAAVDDAEWDEGRHLSTGPAGGAA